MAWPRWHGRANKIAFLAMLLSVVVSPIRVAGAEPARGRPRLPLKVSSNGRYLVDQTDLPFLVVGDTPWSLLVQLSKTDIDLYLQDRHRRGFNSIIVNLIEHKFCTHPPLTRSGIAPFKTASDFSTPNKAYFDFAHRVIQQADKRGIVVWLAPAYLGYGGGDEGFFREMKACGPEKLRGYGRFLGTRFKDLANIVWLLGGDYTPPAQDRWTVTELALGIRETDSHYLMSVHASPETSAVAAFGDQSWLDVNTLYTYEPTLFRPALAEYSRQPARPFVLIESTYEGEHNSTPEQIRRQAYWAMLAGACGQFLGNNPIWHFDGPGLFPVKVSWSQALDSTGSRDMKRLRELFLGIPWHACVPDLDRRIIVDGFGHDGSTATTLLSADRRFAVSYLPSTGIGPRDLLVNTSPFQAPVVVRWFNPATGQWIDGSPSTLPNHSRHTLHTPGGNGSGANDWLLILDGRGARGPRQGHPQD